MVSKQEGINSSTQQVGFTYISDIRLPNLKVGAQPFPSPNATVDAPEAPLLVQTALQSDWLCRLVSHELLHNVPEGKIATFFEASHGLWDFSHFGNLEPIFFLGNCGVPSSNLRVSRCFIRISTFCRYSMRQEFGEFLRVK